MAIFAVIFALAALPFSQINANPVADPDTVVVDVIQYDETRAKVFLEEFMQSLALDRYRDIVNYWNNAYPGKGTELPEDYNYAVLEEQLKEFYKYNSSQFQDAELKRKFQKLRLEPDVVYMTLSDELNRNYLIPADEMKRNYIHTRVCDYHNRTKCDLNLEPELLEMINAIRDPEELEYYWVNWHNKAGAESRIDFKLYVTGINAAARASGFSTNAEQWLAQYGEEDFEEQCAKIIEQLKPFYDQLHAYVRFELRKKHKDLVPERGPIPAHLLGNLANGCWTSIAKITLPYPDKQTIDVTQEMIEQGYTPLKMFQMGDEFFQSLNMTKLPELFWRYSILEKPIGREQMGCHASSTDLYSKDDVRIKQCTTITTDNLYVVHHELGHMQYFLQYQHLPFVYRDGANPGFHEAVGDTIVLSVLSPKHLERIGLLKNYEVDNESRINAMYYLSLMTLAALPFAYTLDTYRYAVFRNEIDETRYNTAYWDMHEKYSGIVPPVARTEEEFDPAAFFHIASNIEYMRYFVAGILQFQFHLALCEKAGQYVPGDPDKSLDNCDIYESIDAGNALKAMLSLGSSKPWPDAMEVLTGTRTMDAAPLLKYFKPLYDFLVKRNEETGAYVGWGKGDQDAVVDNSILTGGAAEKQQNVDSNAV